jgi:uncharacterized protein DUF5989
MSGSWESISGRMDVVRELLRFFWRSKFWWLTPMILVLVLFGFFMVFAQSSAIAPFIYTLF